MWNRDKSFPTDAPNRHMSSKQNSKKPQFSLKKPGNSGILIIG